MSSILPDYDVLKPIQENYNLLLPDIIKNQISLAKKTGFKGFGCYYYWFSDSQHADNMIMRSVVDKLFDEAEQDFKLFFIAFLI